MSSPPIPTLQQLEAARLGRWHQQGKPEALGPETGEAAVSGPSPQLLSVDAIKVFVEQCGLLLFMPRPQLAGAPAPSLVEATLGRAESAPSVTDAAEARRALAAMVADGSAIALNLLGAPGTTAEAPDFVVSAAVFPYVFTLRGDKLWKRPPETAGPLKVSPLGANIAGLLADRRARSAGDLAAELGKGVTEAAVLRALGELWQHLRVLPVLQVEGAPTLWENAADRFTKQMKAGANAGQPTALSALASLYLGQVLLATEEQIATFLSPLASGSRVHEVLHALTAAQQLESLVLEGKRCLHLAQDALHFPELASESAKPEDVVAASEEPARAAGEVSRISKFAGKGSARGDRSGKPFTPRRDAGRPGAPSRRPSSSSPQGERRSGDFAAREGSPRSAARGGRPTSGFRSKAQGTEGRSDRARISPPFRRAPSSASPMGWRPTRRRSDDGVAEGAGGPPSAGVPRDAAPRRFERSGPPRERTSSQRERTGPPRERTGPPRERSGPPRERRGPPRERRGPPRERSGPPRERLAFQKDRSGPPRDRSGPPRDRTGTPRDRTGFQRERSGPPRDVRQGPREFNDARNEEAPRFRRFDAPGDRKRSFSKGGSAPFGKRPDRRAPSDRPTGGREREAGDRARPPRSGGPPPVRRPGTGFASREGAPRREPRAGAREGRPARGPANPSDGRTRRPFQQANSREGTPGKPFAKFAGGKKPWGNRPPPRRQIRKPEDEG